ncbi:MAG: glycine cleavage system protein GcvH [Anaerolineae bacterium]|nr:glycine cleavage system protein GcvH [Anaerolineae bacterium]MDQ7035779.1 glycine cleavage system protein GcvH [Anaerolineae bacterium]
MKYPEDLKYAESDEWIRVDGDTATIGISDYAQEALNDLVYVEFKEVGETLAQGEAFGEVESVKAASEVYLPVAGEITAVNSDLEGDPETVNGDPYGAGWMIKIKITDSSNLANLMDATAYKEYCDNR